MMRRPSVVALARALNLLFFLATSIYALLSANPFTYEQFITPHVSAALTNFAVWHAEIHLFVLSVTALTLAAQLERSPARLVGWSYLTASALMGVWFYLHPLWQLADRSQAIVLAFAAALPPIWLGIFDLASAPPPSPLAEVDQPRLWRTCVITACYAWAVYAVFVPLRVRFTGGIDASSAGLLLGAGASLLAHVVVLMLFGLLVIALSEAGSMSGRTRPVLWLLFALVATVVAAALVRVVLAPISIRGAGALAVAGLIGASVATAWAGISRQYTSTRSATSVVDVWLGPLAPARPLLAVCILALAPAFAQAFVARVSTFDWEFMLQKLSAMAVWIVAFASIHTLVRQSRRRAFSWMGPAIVIVLVVIEQAALPRISRWTGDARLDAEFTLDAYAALDPSFRLTRDVLGPGEGQDAGSFYAYLRSHSTIQDASIKAVSVDFDGEPAAAAHARPPHIFLFIIDSLRPDYLSPYNESVSFTPAISAFAHGSYVFTRAFSRYAGTGLAVPAIWSGAMLIHKQYVTPFAPTNALEKLVASQGYRRFVTEDHISDELFAPSPLTTGLDHNIQEMLHTFCRTSRELSDRLQSVPDDGRPIFAMTRPLELHIGNIASATTPDGESYPGFHGPYAARVKRIDACFGQFIETLKTLQLYDDSIVILTADHGDSLGEGQRWGHGFTVFPEVLRIPLIVHLPARLREQVSADLSRVSFSTDITPTLYALVEGPPRGRSVPDTPERDRARASTSGGGAPREMEKNPRQLLMGEPLFVPPSADLAARKHDSYLVASSYGAVYGLLSRNGRRLYIADAIEGREYLYNLGATSGDTRIGLTDAERGSSRRSIREQIDALAAWYGFTPKP